MKAHVSDFKKKVVADFAKLISEYPIVGLLNMENLPAPQLQNMRKQLSETVVIKLTKKRLMKFAFEKAAEKKPGVEKLQEHFRGMPALLFTKENPFKLFKMLQKNKSSAPAKAGQTAPNDIVVVAGATSFAPGPVIGELGSFGIKTGVEGGKIAIKEDKVIAKAGDVISGKLASLLLRLGIEPMEIGLDLVAVYEDGTIYTKDILNINEQDYLDNIGLCHKWAFNLGFEVGYTTKDNIELFITKAFNDSKAVALESNFMADAVVEQLLGKAEREMLSLKNTANITVEVKKVEEKKVEPKAEAEVKPQVKEESKPVEEKKEAEAPKEEKKEAVEEVKIEKPEEPKEEPKQEVQDQEAPKEEKKEEAAEEKKEEPKAEAEVKPEVMEGPKPVEEVKAEETEDKAEQIIKETKEAFDKGNLVKKEEEKKPSASDILEEIKEEEPKKKEPEKVPTAYELMQKKKKNS
ncbi:50S ribosomal protein L10 [Candidatus Woesearchaeota archaeon]|nr:50S ribosomal protein L10 [Candidatus Woesearchaeota archaeon]